MSVQLDGYVRDMPVRIDKKTKKQYGVLTLTKESCITDDNGARLDKKLIKMQAEIDAKSSGGGSSNIVENILPFPYVDGNKELNGLTFNINDNGTISINGSSTSLTKFILGKLMLFDGVYTLSGNPDDYSNETYMLKIYVYNGEELVEELNSENGTITFTVSENDWYTYEICIEIKESVEVNNITFRPMLETGIIAHDYVEYEMSRQSFREDIDELFTGRIFVDGKGEEVSEILPVNADTLKGHDIEYFASKESVTDIVDGKTVVGESKKLDGYGADEWFLHPVKDASEYTRLVDLPNGKWAIYEANKMFSDYPSELIQKGLIYGTVVIDTSDGNTSYKSGIIRATNASVEEMKVVHFFYDSATGYCKFHSNDETINKIISGETVVGKAKDSETLNGIVFYKKFNEINSNFTQDTPLLDVIKAMSPHSKFIVTIYNASTDIYPVPSGILEIEKTGESNFETLSFTGMSNKIKYHARAQCALDLAPEWYTPDGGNANKLGNETAEEWQNKLDNIQTTSKGILSQPGWYIVAEYALTNEASAIGSSSNMFDVLIKRGYNQGLAEYHLLRFRSTYSNQSIMSLDSKGVQLISKARYVYDSNKAYFEIYYNSDYENPVSIEVLHPSDSFLSWKSITPTLTSETVEGVTVTTTYDIPANAKPLTDLDLSSKNIFDSSTLRKGDYIATDFPSIRVSQNVEDRPYVKAGETYTISSQNKELMAAIIITDENNTKLLNISDCVKLPITFTVDKNGYLAIIFGNKIEPLDPNNGWGYITVDDVKNSKVQIERGTVATEYSEFFKTNTELTKEFDNKLDKDGGTIGGTNAPTPLLIKGTSQSFIGFTKDDGTILGYLGFGDKNKPTFYLSDGINGSELLTPANIGGYALPLSGGTVGNGQVPYSLSIKGDSSDSFIAYRDMNSALIGLLGFKNGVPTFVAGDGSRHDYLFHTGNKPSGSYNGNGSTTTRTINTGGIGNMIAIYSSQSSYNTLAIVSECGAIYFDGSGAVLFMSSIIYSEGVITINTANPAFNASGVTYTYQVL